MMSDEEAMIQNSAAESNKSTRRLAIASMLLSACALLGVGMAVMTPSGSGQPLSGDTEGHIVDTSSWKSAAAANAAHSCTLEEKGGHCQESGCNGDRYCSRHGWCTGESNCFYGVPSLDCAIEEKGGHCQESGCQGSRECSRHGWCQGDSKCSAVNVRKIKISYQLLQSKEGKGKSTYTEKITTGFVAESSSASKISTSVSGKIEAAAYGVAVSAEASHSQEFASSFKSVSSRTREVTRTFTAPEDESWYLYQAETKAWMTDGTIYTINGIPMTFNSPQDAVVTEEIDYAGIAHVETFRKHEMQFFSYEGEYHYNRLGNRGWKKEAGVGWDAFTKQQPGTVAVNVWRKDEMAYYLPDGETNLTPHMKQWGWRKTRDAIFYAYPPGGGPPKALQVHVWRKGEKSFYVQRTWKDWDHLPEWGWQYEREAFRVSTYGL